MSGQGHDGQPPGRLAIGHRHGGVPLVVANVRRGLKAVHHRHLTVHENQVVSASAQPVERLAAIVRDVHGAAKWRQHGAGDFLVDHVVLDQQDPRSLKRQARPAAPGRRGFAQWAQAAIIPEQPAQAFPQRGLEHGLVEILVDPGLALPLGRGIPKRHRGQQRQLEPAKPGIGANRQGQFRSGHLRHRFVQQRDGVGIVGGMGGSQALQRRRPAGGVIAADAPGQQLIAQQLAAGRIVVDHQHAPRREPVAAVVFLVDRPGGARQGQFDAEGRTHRPGAAHADRAAHQFHQLPGDGQAQPGSAILAGHRAIGLVKRIENPLLVRGRNANSRIAHLETQPVRGGGGVQHRNPRHDLALLGELDGVTQQIAQNLAQPDGIAPRVDRLGRQGAEQFQILALRALGKQDHHFLDQIPQDKVHRLQFQLARLDLGEIQDVVDDPEQSDSRLLDHLGEAPLLGIQLGSQQQFGHAQNAVHGRADFVAHVGQKLGFGLAGRLGPFLGRAQFPNQHLQFHVGDRKIVGAGGDRRLQPGVVGGQLGVASLNLREHVVESIHQRAQFVVTGARRPHRVIAGGGYRVHRRAQLQDRP